MEDLDLQSKAEAFSEEAENWWANLDDGERLEIYFEKNPNKHEKEFCKCIFVSGKKTYECSRCVGFRELNERGTGK